MRTIVFTDIHGMYNEWVQLCEKVKINFLEDEVIFLGDYVDRGYDPLQTLKSIKQLSEKHKNVHVLKGNHEDMLVKYYKAGDTLWFYNGGTVTANQFNALDDDEVTEYVTWCNNLPMSYSTDEYRFCHSGYWNPTETDTYGNLKILWDRDWLKTNNYDSDTRPIVCGHTPLNEAATINNRYMIDTCAFGGNKLTCLVIEGNNVDTVSVPCSIKKKGKEVRK